MNDTHYLKSTTGSCAYLCTSIDCVFIVGEYVEYGFVAKMVYHIAKLKVNTTRVALLNQMTYKRLLIATKNYSPMLLHEIYNIWICYTSREGRKVC